MGKIAIVLHFLTRKTCLCGFTFSFVKYNSAEFSFNNYVMQV